MFASHEHGRPWPDAYWLSRGLTTVLGMDSAEHGHKRGKRVGDGVPLDAWVQCLSGHVQDCIASGIATFPIGSYVHIRSAHAACMQSVMSMLQLLKMMFTRAPEGIVNYTKLCSVLERLAGSGQS